MAATENPPRPQPTPDDGDAVIRRMLQGRRVAVVGLSDDPSRASFRIANYLQGHGYTITPVNPHALIVLGEHCVPTLADAPGPIDSGERLSPSGTLRANCPGSPRRRRERGVAAKRHPQRRGPRQLAAEGGDRLRRRSLHDGGARAAVVRVRRRSPCRRTMDAKGPINRVTWRDSHDAPSPEPAGICRSTGYVTSAMVRLTYDPPTTRELATAEMTRSENTKVPCFLKDFGLGKRWHR